MWGRCGVCRKGLIGKRSSLHGKIIGEKVPSIKIPKQPSKIKEASPKEIARRDIQLSLSEGEGAAGRAAPSPK